MGVHGLGLAARLGTTAEVFRGADGGFGDAAPFAARLREVIEA
ncbi:hypothetical protein [Dactylosporangium sp. NPDC051484]